MPKSQAVRISGQSGDFLVHVLNWLPKGVLEYSFIPGHTPGMIALLHKPAQSFSAAATFTTCTKFNLVSWQSGCHLPLAHTAGGLLRDPCGVQLLFHASASFSYCMTMDQVSAAIHQETYRSCALMKTYIDSEGNQTQFECLTSL